MNIRIHNLRVNTITMVGSLNIGKAVLCHNRASYAHEPQVGGVPEKVGEAGDTLSNHSPSKPAVER